MKGIPTFCSNIWEAATSAPALRIIEMWACGVQWGVQRKRDKIDIRINGGFSYEKIDVQNE